MRDSYSYQGLRQYEGDKTYPNCNHWYSYKPIDRYRLLHVYLLSHEDLAAIFRQVMKYFAQCESVYDLCCNYMWVKKLGETSWSMEKNRHPAHHIHQAQIVKAWGRCSSIMHGWGWGPARVSWRGREVHFHRHAWNLPARSIQICLSSSPWTNARSVWQWVWRSVVDSLETSCKSLQRKLPAQATQFRNADSLSHLSSLSECIVQGSSTYSN